MAGAVWQPRTTFVAQRMIVALPAHVMPAQSLLNPPSPKSSTFSAYVWPWMTVFEIVTVAPASMRIFGMYIGVRSTRLPVRTSPS